MSDAPADSVPLTSLATLVEERGRLPLGDALELLRTMAEAMAAYHDQGNAYGAIGPQDVMFDNYGEVTLRAAVEPEVAGVAVHAPEIHAGTTADSCADVFCLGLMLRLMLTGRLDGHPGKMPEPLQQFFRAATSEAREGRFQTAAQCSRRITELQEEVEELAAEWARLNVPVRKRLGDHLRAFAGRQWVAICLALVLVVVLGTVGWKEWREHKEREFQRRLVTTARERADRNFEQAQLRDAAVQYEHYLLLVDRPRDRGHAFRRLVECYRRLKDEPRELRALLRYLGEFPDSKYAAEFEARTVELSMEAIDRFGGLVPITTDRTMVVDGKPDDWEGLKPLALDQPRDSLLRRPASDLVAFYCVVAGETLVMRFDTLGDPASRGTAYCIGIDDDPRTFTDTTEDWDYEVGFTAGRAWIWDLRYGRTYQNSESSALPGARLAVGKVVEASFPLAAINSPRIFSLRAKTYSMVRNRDDDEMPRKVIVTRGKGGSTGAVKYNPPPQPAHTSRLRLRPGF